MAIDTSFALALPKIELHAHLTGSISPECLRDIWLRSETNLEDPSIALQPIGKQHHDISTFFKIFDTFIYDLVNTPQAVQSSTNSVLQGFWKDGVKYLELRTTPRRHEKTGMEREEYLEAVLHAIENFEERHEMPTYLILSIDRRNTLEQALHVVELAVRYQSRGVVGVDLCGNPTVGPVGYLAPAFEEAKKQGLKVTLHFAEVPASSSEEEMRMLLEWRPDRIGHVIHTTPSIDEEIERQGFGLELCLSCNVLAKMLPGEGGYVDHHFGRWKNWKNPIALSTDDVGVFGSSLSNEYQLAALHFGLNKTEIVDLSRRAISSIFAGEDEKARLHQSLDDFVSRECGE
ncbi:hypothetical protein CBER1_10848 [Cercospora berteroae]|uniref:Adenosine deaminase domain-containing protein n=1 Tax=Cercospora berteroae TaxID=357750 RepID=A0A2S6BYT0_9PEZI|nr:hypothetical protein CBER1_10848 [Cercospora berteroae]